MSRHTNGPWTIPDIQWDVDSPEAFKSLIRIADANGKYDVAYAADDSARMQANAKLIAAAPELKDALVELLAAQYAQFPPAEAGQEAQNAWADRRAAARNNATALIERLS
jgi:hypothetical protein